MLIFSVRDDILSPWNRRTALSLKLCRFKHLLHAHLDLQLYEKDNASYHRPEPILLRHTYNLHITAFISFIFPHEHACVRERICIHIRTAQLHADLLPWESSNIVRIQHWSELNVLFVLMCVPACTATFHGRIGLLILSEKLLQYAHMK